MQHKKLLAFLVVLLLVVIFFTSDKFQGLRDRLRGFSLSSDIGAQEASIDFSRDLLDTTGNPFGTTNTPVVLGSSKDIYIGSEEFLSQSDANGVIVQFKKDPALKARANAIEKNKSPIDIEALFKGQKNSVKAEHSQAQAAIEKVLEKKLTEKGPKRRNDGNIRYDKFTDSVNGFVIYDVPVAETISKLKNLPMVKDVQPNYRVQADLLTSVPQTKIDQVWQYADSDGQILTGNGMNVGILDTGVDYTHPDLGGCFGPNCRVKGGYDFFNNDADPMDDHYHGTHVAGIVAGSGVFTPSGSANPVSIFGVAPDANIYAFKVLGSAGSGTTSTIIKGIEACGDPNGDGNYSDHLDVCNMSLGGGGNPDDASSTAVDNITLGADVLFAVSAGNSGPAASTIGSPGTARRALTVAAACNTGEACSIANFSSRGPVTWVNSSGAYETIQKPDISAPGVGICSAKLTTLSSAGCGDGHTSANGTSMASPHIAGIAAVLRQAHPQYLAGDIKDFITQTAVPYAGVDVNAQGAGHVDSLAALNFMGLPSQVMQITGFPLIFVDNVTQKNQTFTKTINVKNISSSNIVVNPSFPGAQPGFTATFSPTSLSISQGASASIVINYNIDHSIVSSPQTLIGTVLLSSNLGDVFLPTNIQVKRRLISDSETVDLGFMNGASSSWSNSTDIQLTNTLLDLASNYTTSVVCCTSNGATISGVNVSLTPSSVSLSPGESRPYTLNVSVSNGSNIPNGNISGKLIITSSLETLEIPFSFYKGYKITLNLDSDVINSGWASTINMYNANTNYLFYADSPVVNIYMSTPNSYSFFLDKKGQNTWVGKGAGSNGEEINTYIVKRNITTSSVNPLQVVHMGLASDATKKIQFSPTRPDGSNLGLSGMMLGLYDAEYEKYLIQDNAIGVWVNSSNGYFVKDLQDTYVRTNTWDSNVKFLATALSTSNNSNELATYMYQLNQGMSADVIFNNTASDFGTKYLYAFLNHPISSASPKKVYAAMCSIASLSPFQQFDNGAFKNYCLNMSLINVPFVDSNQPVIVKSLFKGDITPELTNGAFYPNVYFALGTDPGKYKANPVFKTNNMLLTKDSMYTWRNLSPNEGQSLLISDWNYANTAIESIPGNMIYLGAGPVYDSTRLENAGSNIKINSYLNGPLTTFGGTSKSWPSYDGGLDGTTNIENNDVTYTLKRSGAVVDQGTISPIYVNGVFGNGYMNKDLFDSSWLPLELSLVSPVTINNIATQNSTTFTFSMALGDWSPELGYYNTVDSRPPFIENMHIVGNNIWQHVIDNSKTNTITFTINPNQMNAYSVIDSVTSTTMQISTNNGTSWSNIPLTGSNGMYQFQVPVSGGTSLYTFKLYATDLAGNSITHQFQIPSGTHIVPGTTGGGTSDTVPPVVGTLSVVGQPGATTVSGQITLEITATDSGTNATGIDKVEFYSGATLLGTDQIVASGNLYSFQINTALYSNGNKVFFAKAYDNASNVTTSGNLTLNIQNTSGGTDTIAPAISFSSPSGSTLPNKGIAKIKTLASDASGIASIDIKIDGVSEKTCNSSTSCDFNWKMSGVSSGTHTLEAVAVDNAGNSATATKIMIKP